MFEITSEVINGSYRRCKKLYESLFDVKINMSEAAFMRRKIREIYHLDEEISNRNRVNASVEPVFLLLSHYYGFDPAETFEVQWDPNNVENQISRRPHLIFQEEDSDDFPESFKKKFRAYRDSHYERWGY